MVHDRAADISLAHHGLLIAESGFNIDASDCRDRLLREGERCVIHIALKQRIGETVTLTVATDAGGEPERMTVIALE